METHSDCTPRPGAGRPRPPAGAGFSAATALLARARGLDAAAWDRAIQQAHAAEAETHLAAVRALTRALIGHPQSRALDAINRAACDAARSAARPGDRLVSQVACSYGGRVAAQAALALALADELPPDVVRALTAPFDGVALDGAPLAGAPRAD